MGERCRLTAGLPKLAIVALGLVAPLAVACGPATPKVADRPSPSPSRAITPVVKRAGLACQARAGNPRPRDRGRVGIRVQTVAHARVTASAGPSLPGHNAAGRASAAGTRTLWLRVGSARPGARVVVDVRVARHGRKGTCQAWFRPRRARARPAPPAASPAPSATGPAQPAAPTPPPPTRAPAPPPPAPSCHPLTNGGKCYEPGEFCRDSDHGVHGVAADGKAIICEDNDGWRWEPV